jgi:hypothetical protein
VVRQTLGCPFLALRREIIHKEAKLILAFYDA